MGMGHAWPFFTLYGGKWRAAPHYPKPHHIPLIEPFAGSAGYAVRWHGHHVILVEKDPAIAATWRYLLAVSPEEVRGLPDVKDDQTVDDLPVAAEARLLIGWWLNKGTTRPCRKPSAWMRSRVRPRSYWCQEIRDRIASQLDDIRHWQLIEGDYTAAPDIVATWFIDPPYQKAGKHYRCGSRELDYGELADWCRSRRGQVIVCETAGADWLPFEPFRDIKASPAKHGGKVSREVVWTEGP
jgi:hypothetical protein